MSYDPKREDRFEDAAHKLFGCLAQSILLFVLIANILAYVFSEKYRSTFPLGKFILCTLAWTGLTAGFWWIMRDVGRMRSPFRTSRPSVAKRVRERKSINGHQPQGEGDKDQPPALR